MPLLKKLDLSENALTSIDIVFENTVLESLVISDNRIAKVHPNAFQYLKHLKVLDLRVNRIFELKNWPESKNLETVIVSFNQLTTIPNIGSDIAPNLKILDLKNNKLTDLPDGIFTLSKLSTLDISNNDFSKLPNELGLMASLIKLFIEGNPLKTIKSDVKTGGTDKLKKFLVSRIDPAKISSNENNAKITLIEKEMGLQVGSKDFNKIIFDSLMNNSILCAGQMLGEVPREVLSFEKVHTIDFSKNNISRFPMILAGMRSLRTIKLNDNLIEEIEWSELAAFPSLEFLEVKNNKLAKFCNDYETDSRRCIGHVLQNIDLSKNSLKTVSGVFSELPKLNTLNLSFNLLTNVEPLFRHGNFSLDVLILANNKIDKMGPGICNLFKLSSLVLENNNIKNFPNQIGLLKLKSLNILGNPSMMSTSKNTSKGAQFLVNSFYDRLDREEIRQYEARVYQLTSKNPTNVAPAKNQVSSNKDKIEEKPLNEFPVMQAQSKQSVPTFPKSSNKLIEEEPLANSKPSLNRFDEEPIKNQPRSFGGLNEEPNSKTSSQNLSQKSSGGFLAEEKVSQSLTDKDSVMSKITAENQLRHENMQRIKLLQDQLDNDFSLSNIKRQQIRKELNGLRSKLN